MLIHIVNQFRVKLNENIVDSDDKIAKMGGKTYNMTQCGAVVFFFYFPFGGGKLNSSCCVVCGNFTL